MKDFKFWGVLIYFQTDVVKRIILSILLVLIFQIGEKRNLKELYRRKLKNEIL